MKNHLHLYEAPSVCGPCGGRCCKSSPGIVSPEDCGAPDESAMSVYLAGILSTGVFTIDWWDGDTCYFVRPAIEHHEGKLMHAGWGGTCTLLTPTGCSLEHNARPFGCRSLKPGGATLVEVEERGICIQMGGGKEAQVFAWKPYQHLLQPYVDMPRGGEHHFETLLEVLFSFGAR